MGLLSFLTWPIRLVLHSRPGQLAVFLLEKTAQVAADGIEAVVGRGTVGTSLVDPAKSGTKEGQGKLAVKSDKATILRWLQNWLRSLQGKAPTTGTIEPLEMVDGGGVVATKRSDKVGLVTCALYVLNPLNDIVLAVRLLEYTRGIIFVSRNKSSDCSPVAERSPLSPSKNTEFEAKDADSTIKPPTRTQAITKPDAPQRASPKSPVKTTKVTPAGVPRKIPAAVPRTTPATSTTVRSPTTPAFSPVKIAPYRTSVSMRQPPSKAAAGPAAQSTASTAPREASTKISEHTDDSYKLETKTKTSSKERISKTKQEERSKDAVPAHRTIKSPGGPPPVSTAKPSALITQIPPDQDVSKPSAEKSSTVVLSATVSASPKANTRVVSVQSVSKPLSEAAAADDNTNDVQVPAKISADEPDKVDIKTKPQSNEGIIIDSECRKGQTKSKKLGQSGEEESAKEAFISRRTIQPPPSGTVVKPPIRSTDGAGSGPVADSTADPPAQTSRMAHSYSLVYKTTGLPSKIHLDQSTSKPEAETARPGTSTNKSPPWATGKPQGGPGLLANMLSRQARDLGSAEYPLDSTIQSTAGKAGLSFDQGSSAVPKTKITANTKSETASVKSTTGSVSESTAGISSDGDAKVQAGTTDDPGKSGKQSKLKPWKKWKPSKK
ncbi:mucin-5AC-like isoform X2 [Patiria miniata]|uniref:Uncharacterized protein n=1 Tax=Patiria miniata TaxID=46514 RepID=A0A914BE02_PATMI|nr:mucin-5AC-like isoform X2 [Patiria miniata]